MNRGLAWTLSVLLALCGGVLILGCTDGAGDGESFIDNLADGNNDNDGDQTNDTDNDDEDQGNSADNDETNVANGDDPIETVTDSDGDGFTDDEEINGIPGSDPENPDDTPDNPIDTDADGCSDFDELNFAGFCDNDPNTGLEVEDDDPAEDDDDDGGEDNGGENPPDDTDDDDGGDDETFTFELSVSRHVDTEIADATVDAVFAVGSSLLQEVDAPCADIATNTTFVRNGETTTFETGTAFLTSESQLDAVFDLPEDVKVVTSMIGVCGAPSEDDMTVILGCAFAGGSLVIIADADPDVWVHEWGHVQGLLHRDDCARNIMHSFEVSTNAVNATERLAFISPTPTLAKLGAGDGFKTGVKVDPLLRRSAEPLTDWLHRLTEKNYLAGVPTPVAKLMDSDASIKLEEMLLTADTTVRPRNVIRLLGFAGDPAARGTLMEVSNAYVGPVGFGELAAIGESFLALGRLAQSDPTGDVLAWLMEGVDPDIWARRGVNWTYAPHTPEQTHEWLARLSVMALGVSGQQAALQYLDSIVASDEQQHPLFDQIEEAKVRLRGLSPRAATARPALPQP